MTVKWPDSATIRAEQCVRNRALYGTDDFPGGLPVIGTGESSTPQTAGEESGSEPDWDADDAEVPEWTG